MSSIYHVTKYTELHGIPDLLILVDLERKKKVSLIILDLIKHYIEL